MKAKEQETTTEELNEPSNEGVKLSEEFQKQVYELLEDCTEDEANYVRDCASKICNDLQSKRWKKENEGKEMSVAGMPE